MNFMVSKKQKTQEVARGTNGGGLKRRGAHEIGEAPTSTERGIIMEAAKNIEGNTSPGCRCCGCRDYQRLARSLRRIAGRFK